MNRMIRTAAALVLAAALAACGSSSKSSSGAATTPVTNPSAAAASAALATKLGISETYVTTALSAAQSALGDAGEKTADQKAAAAQVGVDKASAQAEADGKAFTGDQKTGLLEGLKGIL